MEFETDANGIVTFFPVAEWGVSIVQGQSVGLAFDYLAGAADVSAQRRTRIQLHLSPEAAVQLGRLMQARGEDILKARGT